MKCKYCNQQMRKDETVCPSCGKDNAKISVWKIVLAVTCCALLVTALTGLILNALGIFRDNDIYFRDDYYAKENKVLNNADKVIATVNGKELTNRQFQILYWLQVYSYQELYGSSTYDLSKPLNEQIADKETGMSWQQFFIEDTLLAWHRYQLIMSVAEEEGFQLPEEDRKTIANMPASLETSAKNDGYASAQAKLEQHYGVGATVDAYIECFRQISVVEAYIAQKEAEINPTQQELSAYYEANKETLNNLGIYNNINAKLVNVRHILVQLDNVEVNSDYSVTYTDAQWELCKQEAEKIYAEWEEKDKDKEKLSEETFAELAVAYSKDEGTYADGGLIENVYEGEMVSEFNDWIYDEGREPGDHGMVKTKFGYHLIYYVESNIEWEASVKQRMQLDVVNEIIKNASDRWSMDVDYKKIVLFNVKAS